MAAGKFFCFDEASRTWQQCRDKEFLFYGEGQGVYDFAQSCRALRAAAPQALGMASFAPSEMVLLKADLITELYPSWCKFCKKGDVRPSHIFRDEWGLICVLDFDKVHMFMRGRGQCEHCAKRLDVTVDDVRAAVPDVVAVTMDKVEDDAGQAHAEVEGGSQHQGRWPLLVTLAYAEDALAVFKDVLNLRSTRGSLLRQQKSILRDLVRMVTERLGGRTCRFEDLAPLG